MGLALHMDYAILSHFRTNFSTIPQWNCAICSEYYLVRIWYRMQVIKRVGNCMYGSGGFVFNDDVMTMNMMTMSRRAFEEHRDDFE